MTMEAGGGVVDSWLIVGSTYSALMSGRLSALANLSRYLITLVGGGRMVNWSRTLSSPVARHSIRTPPVRLVVDPSVMCPSVRAAMVLFVCGTVAWT